MTARTTLVLGGARSGKSAFAERLVEGAVADGGHKAAIYLATGEAGDGEMADRIRIHRERRGDGWITVEEPLDIAGCLAEAETNGRPVLIDCLTLWLSNLMAAGMDLSEETQKLISAIEATSSVVVLVANEVGLGIVPDNALARDFRDGAGALNQAIAAGVDRVVFVAAGIPLEMKPGGTT